MQKTIWAGAVAGVLLSLGLCARGELGVMPEDWQKATNYLVPWTDGKRVFIRDFRGRDLLELKQVCLAHPCIDESKDDYWAYDTKIKSAVQLDPNIVRVEYENTRPDDFKEHYALIVSEGGPRLHIENRVVVRKGGRRIGTASGRSVQFSTMFLHPVEPCALPKSYSRGGIWRKPAEGESYEASGATLIPYVVPEGGLFLWCDTVGEHRDRLYDDSFCLRYRPSDLAEALRDATVSAENAKGAIMPATGEYFKQVNGDAADAASAKPGDAQAKPDAEAAKANAAPMSEPAKADLAYSNVVTLYYLPWKDAAFVAAAMQTGAPLAAVVQTGKDFNLFDSSKEKPSFDVVMMNAQNAPSKVTCRVVARNFDGRIDLSKTVSQDFAPYEIRKCHFDLPADRKREYWFVNAEFDDGKTNSFIRADIATLEPHKFKSLDTSLMGIAASFDIPSAAACDRLLTRMGARWIRTGGGADADGLAAKGRRGILSFHLDDRATNETQRLAFATEKLKLAVAKDCPIVEIGNELNFGAWGDEAKKRATNYCTWLKSFCAARAALKLEKKVKISTFGFAGCVDGEAFYRAMDEAGCWDFCDVLSLHPGRLNQTPDNPGCDWQWNYRSQIQTTKRFLRYLREKKNRRLDLILTEVYARTPPNKDDSDSTRSAAENVVLSCALAKVEGATALNWYQMHDSVHFDVGAINEYNTEYHYGLLRRDGTVKPSVLAFCTISEALDGATFDREAAYDDARRAWLFKTPNGPMAVLYDRRDGYFPYDGMFTGRPFHGHLEPWLDHWKSHTDYYYEAPRGFVVVRDAIGRTKKVKADKQGRVKLTLSGAPLIVYGLGAPVPTPGATPRALPDCGLFTSEGATPESVAAFRSAGGSFAIDANLGGGLSDCVYADAKTIAGLAKQVSEADAKKELVALYAKGVRRVILPLEVSWTIKEADDRKAAGRELSRRLTPYATARAANPKGTPELWVLPGGDLESTMKCGVREKVSGFVYVGETFPWTEPKHVRAEFLERARWLDLPGMFVNFGPIGFNITWADQGREALVADGQFFGSLLLLNLQPECRAIAMTSLKDVAQPGDDKAPLGPGPFASSVSNMVNRYVTTCGFFDKNGTAKSRLKAMAFARKLAEGASATEFTTTPGGLRVIRFWRGGKRCAVVWQGDRNAVAGWAIDDMTGRPEAKEVEVRAVAESPKAKLRVVNIYGEEQKVAVKNGQATVKANDVPLVLIGCREVAP